MKHYLLFDSGCSLCTSLAQSIEQASHGWLTAHSLRDPDMQALLNQAKTDWKWEPTLLDIDGNKVHAYTGLALRSRLLIGLGPKRAWHVAQLARNAGVPLVNGLNLGRRKIVGQGGKILAGTVVASQLAGLASNFQVSTAEAKSVPPPVHPLARVKSKTTELLKDEDLNNAITIAIESPDVKNIWTGEKSSIEHVMAARHTLENGNILTTVAWQVSQNEALAFYSLAEPIGHYRSQAMLQTSVADKAIVMTATSVNGRKRVLVSLDNNAIPSGNGCSTCTSWNWGCVAGLVGGCITCLPSCTTCVTIVGCVVCLACLDLVCSTALAACCNQWSNSIPVNA